MGARDRLPIRDGLRRASCHLRGVKPSCAGVPYRQDAYASVQAFERWAVSLLMRRCTRLVPIA